MFRYIGVYDDNTIRFIYMEKLRFMLLQNIMLGMENGTVI